MWGVVFAFEEWCVLHVHGKSLPGYSSQTWCIVCRVFGERPSDEKTRREGAEKQGVK